MGADEIRKLREEARKLAEDSTALADEVGFSFWDGADAIIIILSIVAIILGVAFAPASGGASLVLTILGVVLLVLDLIVKICDAAEKAAQKERADKLRKQAADLERRLRDIR